MATVDDELIRMGHVVRQAAESFPTRSWSVPAGRRVRPPIAGRALALAVLVVAVIVVPALLFRSSSTQPEATSPPVSLSAAAAPDQTTEGPVTTVEVPPEPHLWYLLDAPDWELITANATQADVGIVNVRYSVDPSTVFTSRASLTAVADPSRMPDDLQALLARMDDPKDLMGEAFEDPVGQSLVVDGYEIELRSYTDHFHYAMWIDPSGAGLALYANGPGRDEFIDLIRQVVSVSQQEWDQQAESLLPSPPASPSESDWIDASDGLTLAILRAEDGTIAVWSRISATGDAQIEFYGDHTDFTGFVSIPLSETQTLIAAVDKQRTYSGPISVFLADGTRIDASIVFDPDLGIGTTIIEHPADPENTIIQVATENTPGG